MAIPGDFAWMLPGYTHARELGAGAAGRVVMARHDETGTMVAIKYLSVAGRFDVEGLRAEAGLLAGLDSPHVTKLYEYVEGPYGAAIVMELVDGVSLRDLLDREGATTLEAALTVLKGSLLGLAAAHEAQVVHRDYKPGNVLITTDGGSKLVDFGIAVPSGNHGTLAGTPAYMAPEQWAGRAASPATDVYAATATFFECLTGAKPYPGTTLVELAVQHTEAPIPAEQAPEALRPLIRAGMAKAVHARPASAAALVAELDVVASRTLGEDWEQRGRRHLAALLALLPLLLPSQAASGQTAGATSLATTKMFRAHTVFRHGRRAKTINVLAGAALVCAVIVGIAVAGTSSSGHAHAGPGWTSRVAASPDATSQTTSPPSAPSSPHLSPSPGRTRARSRTKRQTVGPLPGPPAAAGTAQPPQIQPSAPLSPSPAAPSGPPATPAASPPTSPAPSLSNTSASPTPTPSPRSLHVLSVRLTDVLCDQGVLSATATVTSDGAASGTLHLTWLETSRANDAMTPVATDTITLPPGQTRTSITYSHRFTASAALWGVTAATTPAAETGQGASAQTPNCQRIT